MSDLVEFLLARIAEDEVVARACVGPDWAEGLPATIHPDPTTYRTVTRRVGHVCGSIIAADAIHIARHDPARVLAECEAKRRIVQWAAEHPIACDQAHPTADVWHPEGHGPHDVLRLLALPYADHPDYDEAWRP